MRDKTTGGGGGMGAMSIPSPPPSIPEPKKVQTFQLRMFRIYTDQKFQNFYCVCYNFWTIFVGFSFFLTTWGNRSLHVWPSEKVRCLTLDLLKSFFLWNIRKKTTWSESLNLRFQANSWIYRKSPIKQEKHPL